MSYSSTPDNMVMPVAPMGSYGGNSGFGWGGDGAWWLLVLFLFAANGNGFGWGNGGMNGMMPYMTSTNTNNDVQRGFDQQAITSGINGLESSINGIGQALCNGFATAEVAENSRQMANMQQMFALQSQMAQCCCDNRLATANLNATILSENCADRAAFSDGIRDVIANQTANTQALINQTTQAVQGVYDKICQLELNAKNDRIAELQNQLTAANTAALVGAQTSRVLADNAAQTQALEQYLNPAPIPAYVVQNPNCCAGNYYSGCGCGVA